MHRDWLPDGTEVLMMEPAGRFNHSCEPNIHKYSLRKQWFILAMRDIAQDEELCFDYSIDAFGGEVWECHCGATTCRGKHQCGFFDLPKPKQLDYLPYLDPWFAQVHHESILSLLISES